VGISFRPTKEVRNSIGEAQCTILMILIDLFDIAFVDIANNPEKGDKGNVCHLGYSLCNA